MANIKRKIFTKNAAGNFVVKDISDLSVKLTEIVPGPTNANIINTVKYNSDVITQSLLDLTRDLIANDIAINTEKNAVNELINEGVLDIINYKFDISTDVSSGIKVSIGKGNLKINSDDIKNVFTIEDTTTFNVENITSSSYGWFRRDLIVFVYYDERESSTQTAPYIDYIYGSESQSQKPPYTIGDEYQGSDYGYYPLYEILYQNINGSTYIYGSYEYNIAKGMSEDDALKFRDPIVNRIYEIAGFKSTVQLIQADPYEVAENKWNALEGRYERTLIEGLYSIKDSKMVNCTNANGQLLLSKVGHSSLQEIFEGTSYVVAESDIYANLQEPDVGLRTEIQNGDLLNFPFTLKIEKNQYFPIDSLLLKKIKIAVKNSFYQTDWPEEGLDLQLQTAKYYVNNYNNGIMTIDNIVKDVNYTTITLNNKVIISDLKKMTYNNKSFENIPDSVDPGTTGDFIFIIDGKGKYQCARIKSKLNATQIVIQNLPVDLEITSSKFLIFNKNSLTTIGSAITDVSSNIKRASYPFSLSEGVSSIPWNSTTSFIVTDEIQTPTKYDLNNDKVEVECDIKNASDIVSIYTIDDNITNLKSLINSVKDNLIIFNGKLPVDGDGITKNIKITYNVVSKSLKDRFEETPTEENRLYFDNVSNPGYVLVDFPFNVDINYSQWYFMRISLFDRDIPYSSYGKRPKVMIGNYATLNSVNGHHVVLCKSYPGEYPKYDENQLPVFEWRDGYGELQEESHERGHWDDVNLKYTKPTRYILKARNLSSEFEDIRIPPHREDGSNVAIAYCDITNGLISFNPGNGTTLDSEIPANLNITCYFNNVFNGTIDWADIQNLPETFFINQIRIKDNVLQITKQSIPEDKLIAHFEYDGGDPEFDTTTIDPNSYLKIRNLVVSNIQTENISISGVSMGETVAELVRTTVLRTNTIAPKLDTGSGPILFKAVDPTTSILETGAVFEISAGNNPPTTIPLARGKFIAGKVYNSIWNDIAECMPSDGSGVEGDLMMVDSKHNKFRVTVFDNNPDNFDSIIGIMSSNPGFVVGWNEEYENPICVVLKGMIPLNINKINLIDDVRVGDKLFYSWRHKAYITGRKLRSVGIYFGDVKEIGVIIEKNNNRIKIFV